MLRLLLNHDSLWRNLLHLHLRRVLLSKLRRICWHVANHHWILLHHHCCLVHGHAAAASNHRCTIIKEDGLVGIGGAD